VIAIGIVVVVIPIGAAATTDAVLYATVQARYRRCRVGGPVGGAVVNINAVAANTPAAPPLPPSGVTDPMAAVTTKNRGGTAFAAVTVTAAAKEEEEYDGWEGAHPRHHLDDALLCLNDRILLRSIAAMTVGAVAAGGSPSIATMSMPAIDVGVLFIWR